MKPNIPKSTYALVAYSFLAILLSGCSTKIKSFAFSPTKNSNSTNGLVYKLPRTKINCAVDARLTQTVSVARYFELKAFDKEGYLDKEIDLDPYMSAIEKVFDKVKENSVDIDATTNELIAALDGAFLSENYETPPTIKLSVTDSIDNMPPPKLTILPPEPGSEVIKPTTVPDEAAMFSVSQKSLQSFFVHTKKAEFMLTDNGILKSVNTQLDDQSGDIAANLTTTFYNIATTVAYPGKLPTTIAASGDLNFGGITPLKSTVPFVCNFVAPLSIDLSRFVESDQKRPGYHVYEYDFTKPVTDAAKNRFENWKKELKEKIGKELLKEPASPSLIEVEYELNFEFPSTIENDSIEKLKLEVESRAPLALDITSHGIVQQQGKRPAISKKSPQELDSVTGIVVRVPASVSIKLLVGDDRQELAGKTVTIAQGWASVIEMKSIPFSNRDYQLTQSETTGSPTAFTFSATGQGNTLTSSLKNLSELIDKGRKNLMTAKSERLKQQHEGQKQILVASQKISAKKAEIERIKNVKENKIDEIEAAEVELKKAEVDRDNLRELAKKDKSKERDLEAAEVAYRAAANKLARTKTLSVEDKLKIENLQREIDQLELARLQIMEQVEKGVPVTAPTLEEIKAD